VYVAGRTNVPGFSHYVVEFGEGRDPFSWSPVTGPVYAPVDGGLLAVWNVTALDNRDYSLRVVAFDQGTNAFEARTWVVVQNALPTPTPTWTVTPEPTSTVLPTPTWTPTPGPTSTALPTPTWTPTSEPTSPPPTPTWTPTPTQALPTATAPITDTVALSP
jgi:hypothetical protein